VPGNDNTVSYGIQLEDGVSGAAAHAAGALDNLRKAMERDTSALTALRKAMNNLKAGGEATAAQTTKLQDTIDATKARLAKAQAAYLDLGGGVTRAGASALTFRSRMQALQQQAQQMPGPIGRMVAMFGRFADMVGGGGMALGILGVAAAAVTLTAATIKLTTSLYSYATAQANARRTEGLRLEALTRMWSPIAATFGLVKMRGAELQAGIDRISASTSVSREETAKYGDQLYRMGLRGKQWESALDGMTIKAATQGEAQAQMFASWAAGTALTGGSVDKLTARVKAQLGGLAKGQMLDANVQALKLAENFDAMFRHVNIEPLLKAKAELYSLFSQSTASGRYLTDLLSRIVQPLINAVASAIPVVHHFFQDMIIYALRAEIEWLHMKNALADAFSAKAWRERWDAWKGPLRAIVDTVTAIGVVMLTRMMPQAIAALAPVTLSAWSASGGFVAMGRNAFAALARTAAAAWAAVPPLAAVAAEAFMVAAPFVLAATAVFLLIQVLRGLKQIWDEIDFGALWTKLKADWAAFDWGSFGLAIVDGIASAFAHPGKLLDAVKGLAHQVMSVFTGTLEISSPSKVFARLGSQIPAGVAVGIDAGAGQVRSATADMAMPQPGALRSMGDAAGGGAAPAARGGGGVTINEIHVHASDVGDGRRVAMDIKRELESVLEGLALQMGAV
jgi:hypothetical protein